MPDMGIPVHSFVKVLGLEYTPYQNIRFDKYHAINYIRDMIKTFADHRTQELFVTGKAKSFPSDVAKRATRKLEYIHLN